MEGEMLKGHLDMIVLAALVGGPSHGYGIIQEIREKSRGAFDLPEGTIYPALHRLEKAGYLTSQWTTADTGRKRRIYKMTRSGQRALSDHRALWQRFADAIGGLFGDKSHLGDRNIAPARPHR
jgi:PadR family transcriptional regulator, regulatory protein PadR